MSELFSLLSFLCFIALIVGLIKPSIFNKLFKGGASRKKVGLVFGIVLAILFFCVGITSPESNSQQASQEAKQQNAPVSAEPAPSKSLEQKLSDAIISAIGSKTNMGKQTLVKAEIEKYTAAELAAYGYKSSDSISRAFIQINSSENLTTNLQKGTMNNEALKIVRAVFPLDSNIGDVIIWSQLPVKDQYGNIKDDTAIIYAMGRPLYGKINWDNFSHNDLPSLLKSESSIDDRNGYMEKLKF